MTTHLCSGLGWPLQADWPWRLASRVYRGDEAPAPAVPSAAPVVSGVRAPAPARAPNPAPAWPSTATCKKRFVFKYLENIRVFHDVKTTRNNSRIDVHPQLWLQSARVLTPGTLAAGVDYL